MHLAGEYLIPVGQNDVWLGMNDPDLLKRCIRVCERFERLGDSEFQAVLSLRIGPFRARFTIIIGIENADPPRSYRLFAEGKGGLAGWAHATADVKLTSQAGDTLLVYDATAELQGAVGRLATTILSSAIEHYTEEFFSTFSAEVQAQESLRS